jgi:hypothetical protein
MAINTTKLLYEEYPIIMSEHQEAAFKAETN